MPATIYLTGGQTLFVDDAPAQVAETLEFAKSRLVPIMRDGEPVLVNVAHVTHVEARP